MKKNLIIISLIFAMFTAYAQEVKNENNPTATSQATSADSTVTATPFCHHRINVHVGGAFTNNIYKRVPSFNQLYSLGSLLELQYAYFFTEHWGLGLGIGVSNINAKAVLNHGGTLKNWSETNDPSFASDVNRPDAVYDLNYDAHGLVERQSVWAIEVPLTALFEHKFGGKNGIYAGLGVKGYFPIYAKNRLTGQGDITTSGYEEAIGGVLYQDMPNHFETYTFESQTLPNVKLRCSIDLQADFGGVFGVSPKTDLYLGLFCSYGFLDILPKAEKKVNFVTMNQENNEIEYSGSLGTDMLSVYNANKAESEKTISEKWHLLQVGLKFGVHIKPCATNDKTMKELKREFMEDMIKKSNEPIIVKNTEYVYIVPVCPNEDDNADLIPAKQKAVDDAYDAYEDAKILYDAEPDNSKDKPKLRAIMDGKRNKWLRLQQELEDLKSGKKPTELTPEDRNNIKQLADALSNTKILFDLDKDIPKISDYNDNVNKTVAIMKKNSSLKLVVEGYTCDLGSEEHNRDLAHRRAEKIKQLFIDKGVPANQIETASYTVNDPENKRNIPDRSREEHRAAIFRIIKK